MKESKFDFNPKTLQFEKKARTKAKQFIVTSIAVFTGSILIFIIILIGYSYYFEAKNSKSTQIEYKALEEQYQNLLERKKQNDDFLNELIEKDKTIYQVVLKSEPDNSIFDRKNPYTKFFDLKAHEIIKDNENRLEAFAVVTENHLKDYKTILKILSSKDPEKYKNIPAIQPVYNKSLKYPVYGFGERIDQVYKSLVFHPGIDYAAPEGTIVFATADGTIESAGSKRGLGNRIVINHGNGFKTTYAHLEGIYVRTGNKIKRGDKIGDIGMTGKTLIPHLHYEIQYKKKPINPVNFFFLDLNPEAYYDIRLQSAKSGLSLD